MTDETQEPRASGGIRLEVPSNPFEAERADRYDDTPFIEFCNNPLAQLTIWAGMELKRIVNTQCRFETPLPEKEEKYFSRLVQGISQEEIDDERKVGGLGMWFDHNSQIAAERMFKLKGFPQIDPNEDPGEALNKIFNFIWDETKRGTSVDTMKKDVGVVYFEDPTEQPRPPYWLMK